MCGSGVHGAPAQPGAEKEPRSSHWNGCLWRCQAKATESNGIWGVWVSRPRGPTGHRAHRAHAVRR